mmetsp:Transcript_17642/g.53015  ORF Transcript_17642/g.53015 Transcript_17642/m.53015 type:complete len:251 (-) Transcript_17642:661-1413(-)
MSVSMFISPSPVPSLLSKLSISCCTMGPWAICCIIAAMPPPPPVAAGVAPRPAGTPSADAPCGAIIWPSMGPICCMRGPSICARPGGAPAGAPPGALPAGASAMSASPLVPRPAVGAPRPAPRPPPAAAPIIWLSMGPMACITSARPPLPPAGPMPAGGGAPLGGALLRSASTVAPMLKEAAAVAAADVDLAALLRPEEPLRPRAGRLPRPPAMPARPRPRPRPTDADGPAGPAAAGAAASGGCAAATTA